MNGIAFRLRRDTIGPKALLSNKSCKSCLIFSSFYRIHSAKSRLSKCQRIDRFQPQSIAVMNQPVKLVRFQKGRFGGEKLSTA